MTAPLSQPTVAVVAKDAAAIRKRRRRAPAGGATDDCFTCSKRNVKCDRRRPYCSQCLEIGNECSGYKTQLTWGVGVASRGKLRGLSLPIAKAPPVAREPKKSPASRARAQSSAAALSTKLARSPIDIPSTTHTASTPSTPVYQVPAYDYLSISHHGHAPSISQSSWGSVGYAPGLVHSPDGTPRYTRYPLHLSTDALSSSCESVGSEVDYLSPLSQSYAREEIPFHHSPTILYEGYPAHHSSPMAQSPPTMLVLDHCRAPTSYPGLVYAPSEAHPALSHHHHMDPYESHLGHKLMRGCESLSVPEVDAGAVGGSTARIARKEVTLQRRHSSGQVQWFGQAGAKKALLAKMPFFMDYFRITMAPSMVFIDGPHNPFREHVLRLARDSPSVQHAICALSACNLRMKRRLSLGYGTGELLTTLMAEKQTSETTSGSELEDRSLSDEIQHRNMAVHLLNQQLGDPTRSCHDSGLATILLLCHYRMVESGIAKFHTQFAGVRKILAMRKSRDSAAPLTDSAWMETLFTYLDAISASINEREAQLAPGFEGVSPDVQDLPAGSENMIGCDRNLFKTIGKLGRLNLLSQHRPVQSMSEPNQSQQKAHERNETISTPRPDGSGLVTKPDDNDDEMLASAMSSSASFDERQYLFWAEWKAARQELQDWRFDATSVAMSLPGSPTTGQVRDLGAVSEAFRYAALLYSERLANPHGPSTHSNFQNLVSQVVHHATSLETSSAAEKFLLWPLFVAGSECIAESQQNIIRDKCRGIMSRSGYMNNLAALGVLEKLWSGDAKGEARPDYYDAMGTGKGPFNWTKCLGGPGAGVEWIMF
ncbi:fungal-specific transcription factor domain-containing protein [Trichoderma novae-zelandiae]